MPAVRNDEIATRSQEALRGYLKEASFVGDSRTDDLDSFLWELGMDARVVAIDDDELFLTAIKTLFSQSGIALKAFTDPREAYTYIKESSQTHPVKMAIVDLHMPTIRGDQVIADLKAIDRTIHVMALSGDESPEAAKLCLDSGADYFYRKDKSKDTIILLAEVASIKSKQSAPNEEQIANSRERIKQILHLEGCSLQLANVALQVEKFANAGESVLITGQSGVGKEEVARALHRNSKRSNGPFIALNCGAIHKETIESELFGHMKGSFTGAISNQAGKFIAAHGGTLFLDEIGEMPLNLQVKLLRALQEREITPLGSNQARKFDVRVVSATNKDLGAEIAKGAFREDLYYRLHVLPIHVPALSERWIDIPPIVEAVIREKNRATDQNKSISSDAMKRLQSLAWPGNIRELIAAIKKAYALSDTIIEDSEFAVNKGDDDPSLSINKVKRPEDFPTYEEFMQKTLSRLERLYLEKAMILAHGTKAKAARMTGLPYSTFVHKRKALGLSVQHNESVYDG